MIVLKALKIYIRFDIYILGTVFFQQVPVWYCFCLFHAHIQIFVFLWYTVSIYHTHYSYRFDIAVHMVG